jgi:hypothetical protein
MNRLFFLLVGIVISPSIASAEEFIRLQCETTKNTQASFKPLEAGKATLAVDVALSGPAVRRVLVYGDGKRLATLEVARNTQLRNHTVVDTSDQRRWNLYNTWEVAFGEPVSARLNIDRTSGEIALETKIHSGSDWESSVYSGTCDKVGGNNTKF